MELSAQSVQDFIAGLEDTQKREDSGRLITLIQEETSLPPVMWGSGMIGFGNHHYKYESGREGDTFIVGFAPRKPALVLYGVLFYDQNLLLAQKLGKHTAGKGCLYIKRLADIDEAVLRQMIAQAYKLKTTLPAS